MKVIDLLVKIANGEKVPNIIIVEEDKHYYNKDLKEYINQRTEEKLFEDGYGKYLKYFLNDEVEIIEDTPKEDKEDKKIEKIQLTEIYGVDYNDAKYVFAKRINEIIDKVNGEENEN